MQTAKVFNYGENQAVQLPKNFHLEETEVVIKQLGDVILLMPMTYSHQGIKGLLDGIELEGMIVNYPLLPARPHDVQFLETLVEGSQGIVIGDKGFLSEQKQPQQLLQGVQIITPPRRNMKTSNGWNQTSAHLRKVVETVGSQLTPHFGLQRLKLRSGWHFRHRVIRKVLSHTICIFLNLQCHRSPLEIADLVNG